jgi:Tol biopolymer transport system component
MTMSFRPALLVLAAFAAGSALAAPTTGPSRLLTGADLFNLEVASDPQISPDGKTILYARRANDIMADRGLSSIWSIDFASGTQTPLITGPGSHSQARWSPDGTRLAYISSAEDKVGAQLYVRWMKTGATARITGLADTPHAIAWSPDGERIAYTMFVPDESTKLGKAPDKPADAKWAEPLQIIDTVVYRTDEGGYEKPGYEQLFWVPASGGAPTQVTFGALNAGGKVSWSPDGHALVFSANLTKDWQREIVDTEIHEVSIDTLAVRTLTKRKGPDDAPTLSPDARARQVRRSAEDR